MNILIDKLPKEHDGLEVNTDFRSFILFELLMQEKDIPNNQKIITALNLFYEKIPCNIEKAIKTILWFYTLGKEEKNKKTKDKKKETKKQIYSFEHDADLIYSAFLDQYGIDLNEIEYLHWWKFRTLFYGLKQENKICEIMGYRAIDVSKIKDKEERKRYIKLQNQYALPDNRSEEEKEQEFADAFW